MNAEADVPTQKAQAHAHAWFPSAHGHTGRKTSAQGAAVKGPPTIDRA